MSSLRHPPPPPSNAKGPPPPPPPSNARGPPSPPGGTASTANPARPPTPPPNAKPVPPPDYPTNEAKDTRNAPGGPLGAKAHSGRSAGNEDDGGGGAGIAYDPTFVTVEPKLTEPDYRADQWQPVHFDAFRSDGCHDLEAKIRQSSALLTARTSIAQYTPLHLAVKFNRVNNVQALLMCHSPVDVEDALGQTPYILACRHEVDPSIRHMLADRRPDFEHIDKYSWTALFWACRNGHWTIVRELLRAGVVRDRRDKYGRTAYDIAGHDLIRRLFG